jgi:hypothetical protein
VTASYKAPPWCEQSDSQWADYGVNVGHAVYGGIHFHSPASSAAGSRHRDGTAHPTRRTRQAAVRSALTDLARACGQAAAALAYFRPNEDGKEEG